MPDAPAPVPRGLFCPGCRGVRLTVLYTRRARPGVTVRYRKCSACAARLVTEERVSKCREAKAKKK